MINITNLWRFELNKQLMDFFEFSDVPKVRSRLTAIVLVHEEALRLPFFLFFYRLLGVDQFLIVDNGSRDRTQEILSSEKDFPEKKEGRG